MKTPALLALLFAVSTACVLAACGSSPSACAGYAALTVSCGVIAPADEITVRQACDDVQGIAGCKAVTDTAWACYQGKTCAALESNTNNPCAAQNAEVARVCYNKSARVVHDEAAVVPAQASTLSELLQVQATPNR